jgi:penicillin-binding protein 2
MKQNTTRRRTAVLISLLLVCLLGFGLALYQMQIVNGAEARRRAQKQLASAQPVSAARGEITDRNGTPLLSNQVTYSISLSLSAMGDEQAQNARILSLISLCESYHLSWDDGFPLSLTAPMEDRSQALSAAQTARFQHYASALDLPDPSRPQALLRALKDVYHIEDSYSQADARKIIGVRYELDLRAKGITQTAYVFAEEVPSAFLAEERERGGAGVVITPVSTREYCTPWAAHLLGRAASIDPAQWPAYQALGYPMDATVGRDGAEQAFESYLRGTGGVRLTETNEDGAVVSETDSPAPQPGKTVALTLDLSLQETAERALSDFLTARDCPGGAAVVMDVNTGGVLAMASYPTFDPAQYSAQYEALSRDPRKPLFNRALQGTYAPGSTFKMVTAAAALEEGIITPDTQIEDTGQYRFYSDYQPMCWLFRQQGRTHGSINVSQALEVSCNVFFYDIGRRLTIETLNTWAQAFGLGEKTGIELPESAGTLAGPARSAQLGQDWMPGSTLAAAIGQSDYAFTPLQLCSYLSTLANGGARYRVHLLQSVTPYGETEPEFLQEPVAEDTLSLSSSTLKAIKKGMLAVTQNGSAARYFHDFPVPVCAKTGSAQVGDEGQSNAVFVCFAPCDDPQVAIALVAEQGGSGSALGAVARRILDTYFAGGAEEAAPVPSGEGA